MAKQAAVRLSAAREWGSDYGRKLIAAVRGIAMDLASMKLQTSNFSAITDSSGGTTSPLLVTVAETVPAPFTHVTSTDLAPKAGFDSALTTNFTGQVALAHSLNKLRAAVGLSAIPIPTGYITSETYSTVPAYASALAGVDGSSATALEPVSGAAALQVLVNNDATLMRAMNEVLAAIGGIPEWGVDEDPVVSVADNTGGSAYITISGATYSPGTLTLTAPTASGSGVLNTVPSLQLTAVNTFLSHEANNAATMLLAINNVIGGGLTSLTDNTGGTPTETFAAIEASIPAAFTSAGADSITKTVFDAQMVIYNNSITSMAKKLQIVGERNGMGVLVDWSATAGTASNTLAAANSSTSAADPSTGPQGVAAAAAIVNMNLMVNDLSSLAAVYNQLAPVYDEELILDSSGGTPTITNGVYTLGAYAATGAAVAGTSGAQTIATTAYNTFAALLMNEVSTLAAAINTMLGSTALLQPLHVVATP